MKSSAIIKNKALQLVASLKLKPSHTKQSRQRAYLVNNVIPNEIEQLLNKDRIDNYIAEKIHVPGQAISELERAATESQKSLKKTWQSENSLSSVKIVQVPALNPNLLLKGTQYRVEANLEQLSKDKTFQNQKLLVHLQDEIMNLAKEGSLSKQLDPQYWSFVSIKMSPSGKKILLSYKLTHLGKQVTDINAIHSAWTLYSGPLRKILKVRLCKNEIPKLLFFYDDSEARAQRTIELLAKIEQDLEQ